jgi:hypothetical protein
MRGLKGAEKTLLFEAMPTAIENSLNFISLQTRTGCLLNRTTVGIVSITWVDVVKTTIPEIAKDMTLKALKVEIDL